MSLAAHDLDAPPFAQTTVFDQVSNALTCAQRCAWLISIQGPPGVGKTTAIREYARRSKSAVWLFTARRDTAAVGPMLRELAAEVAGTQDMRATDNVRSILAAASAAAWADPVLLIVDEAQNLNADTLEELRAVHDAGRFGIAFVGNHGFVDRHNGNRRSLVASAQFISRLKMTCDLHSVEPADVASVARARGITEASLIKQLSLLARGPKGLRCIEGVADLAAVLAADETPGAADYRNALAILSHG